MSSHEPVYQRSEPTHSKHHVKHSHRLSFGCHVGWLALTIGISCAHDPLMNFFNEKECDYGRGWYRATHGDFA